MIYIYDGTFEGLLTVLHDAFKQHVTPQRIATAANSQQSLLDEEILVQTDSEKSRKVYNAILNHISGQSLKQVYYNFLAEHPDSGMHIYEYLKLGWKLGHTTHLHLSDDRVLRIHKTALRVSMERHRFLGLVRFYELEKGIFYAPIEPEANLLTLLAPHFAERLPQQRWVLHDVKRSLAVIYRDGEWAVTEAQLNQFDLMNQDSSGYTELWKCYFNNAAVNGRINPRLQKSFMPMKYWKYLVEKFFG